MYNLIQNYHVDTDYAFSSEKAMVAELRQACSIRLNICGSQKRRLKR